jgi:hypothetical protein
LRFGREVESRLFQQREPLPVDKRLNVVSKTLYRKAYAWRLGSISPGTMDRQSRKRQNISWIHRYRLRIGWLSLDFQVVIAVSRVY